ncbi:glycosyltransferase family 2 protein [Nitrococcus mobilis]|uniref:Glycosyltransferase n=1 Tax=Nitrococcus mobilis Nb-231 TaxID=314278 RepID=A4BRS0_9GAMM|nr:glycosyltransferase family 2 protein [Nitrococcus mobilis]EAR21641.1 Glycosyltransferase [Nitrococcus mobilis Nb-231]
MPSFNQAAYLQEAACSVLKQSGNGTELVVVDGGSTDGSLGVLADLTQAFPGRLRWYSAPDGGPAEAINRAVGLARGKIIGWLNSDDVYARGAIRRALRYLQKYPDQVMVYGHGRHINGVGKVVGNYPSLPPAGGIDAFVDGCFICQPTAFFRREVFEELGGLDTRLEASFDFDLWLRLFKRFPGRIGFIRKVQAYSRLHEQCITRRLRERVALEGLAVTARHFGTAPVHWMLTHFEEVLAAHPFHAAPLDLAAELRRLAQLAKTYVAADQHAVLLERVRSDRRLALAARDVMVDVHPDGWAGPRLDVRFQQSDHSVRAVILYCRHASPAKRPLRLTIISPGEAPRIQEVPEKAEFEIRLPVNAAQEGARMIFRIGTDGWFVPSRHTKTSMDNRRLAFLVDRCRLL